jgi:hypothetical protein
MYDPLQVASVYIATFAPRDDVYSAWTERGWRPVREPLTPQVALAGLTRKGPSISSFMIAPGSVSHVLAYDFDTDNGLEQAFSLSQFMHGNGLPSYVETSRRGAHLWCILDRSLPAVALRMAAKGLLQAAYLPDDNPSIEIRPGSDHIDAEWDGETVVGSGLGHALRMPMMPHPKVRMQGQLFRFDGNAVGTTLAGIVMSIDLARGEDLLIWAERWRRPPAVVDHDHRNPRERLPDDDASASELLRTLWGAHDAAPGKVISCPAKQYHAHGDRNKGCKVFLDDRRVLCHTTGCLLENEGKGRGTWELRKLAPQHG